MEKGVLYGPRRRAVILNKMTCGCLIHTQLCKLDTSPEREVSGLKLSVSGRGGYLVGAGIQVTLRAGGPFLHSGLKGQIEKG